MDADDLYGLPLERFVAERTALAKTLRSHDRREDAARVAKLAKPSVAAWAVNQLVRTQKSAVANLFDAGDELARAQAEVISGRGDARRLRDAASRERAAVSALTEAARGLLSSEGHGLTQITLERVSETLHAAALEPLARAQVKDGCLTRELRHVGLGDSATAGVPATVPGRPTARADQRAVLPSASTPAGAAEPDAGASRRAAERAERERAKRLQSARRAEADARRASERAARELEAARERRDRAAEELSEAEVALKAARDHAQQTELAQRRAKRALDRADEAPPGQA
jgi:hypothetical protein